MIKGAFLEPLLWWAYSAIVVTGVCGMIYMAVQQNYRQIMNDPQIQMAEEAASALNAGDVPASVVPRGKLVDLRASLAPWIAVYDSSGVPLEASGQLDGAPPKLPQGVFDTSTWRAWVIGHHLNFSPENENRFTWQHEDVRQAIILIHLNDGRFVAAGRNMRTTEDRIIQLSLNLLFGWAFTLGCLLIASFVAWFILRANVPSR